MGGVDTKCKPNLVDPDALSVITLSDSCVQRLPIEVDGPLEREQRERNIDDFWRERLSCIENAYMESLGVTEREFARLERFVIALDPKREVYCIKGKDALMACLESFPEEPSRCNNIVAKLSKCIDSMAMDKGKKKQQEAVRIARKLSQQKDAPPKCK